jgi:glycosyltransferase involved in cell wall biosynthesis
MLLLFYASLCFFAMVLHNVLFWLFVVAAIVQIYYAVHYFSRILSLNGDHALAVDSRRPVSIVICAKNEAANLEKNLPLILAQRYDNASGDALYEVIVVNDASTDNTAGVLDGFSMKYNNLHIIHFHDSEPRTFKGKKFALDKGVALASHHWLVLIDADCVPATDHWLSLMVAPLAEGKLIVAGYGGYYKVPGLLNAFIRWETLHTFLQYSSLTLAGKPYMAVGRNMACTKNLFMEAKEDEVWNALPSGDDDLLVSIMADEDNMGIVCDSRAFTWSAAKATWGDWARQKQRHLSTGKHYKDATKLLLGIYAASHADLWLCFFALLFFTSWQTVAIIMALRCIIYWFFWAAAARRLKERSLLFFFPFFDIGWMMYNFAFLPYITWKDKQQWK